MNRVTSCHARPIRCPLNLTRVQSSRIPSLADSAANRWHRRTRRRQRGDAKRRDSNDYRLDPSLKARFEVILPADVASAT